jgi:hypothetical protein
VSPAAPRCSVTSLHLGEALRGTASVVRSWVLLEQPGPWGVDALGARELPPGLGSAVAEASKRFGVRIVLIRRHGRQRSRGARCFVGRTGPGRPWLEQTHFEDPREILDLDLSRLARGESLGLRPVEGPVFCVCTHGRHDPCCAEKGRPVAHALATRSPARTWETSHIGGDRFAATLVCFPHGLYFGRVTPDRVGTIADAYRDGRIDLPCYRGRSCWPFIVQAAECWLREETGIVGVDELDLVDVQRDIDPENAPSSGTRTPDSPSSGAPPPAGAPGEAVTALFAGPRGRRWTVRVRARRAEPWRTLTCHSARESLPYMYDLLDISEAPDGSRDYRDAR